MASLIWKVAQINMIWEHCFSDPQVGLCVSLDIDRGFRWDTRYDQLANMLLLCFLSQLFHKYGWVLVWKPIYSLLLCFYSHIKNKIILLNPNCLNCDFHLSGIPCTGKKPKQLFWGYLLLDYVFDINWPLLCIGIVRGFLFLEQSAKFQVRRTKIVQNCQIEHYQWFITEV